MLISVKTMSQLYMFIVLFSALVAVASASYRCGDNGNWYFCNLKLNEIHIVMTHNSLSFKRGIAKNQSRNLVSQFRDGVRGFNFDLYPCPQLGYPNPNCDVIWTQHGGLFQDYDPTKEIKALVAELQKSEYRDEVRMMTFNFYNHTCWHFIAHNIHQPCYFTGYCGPVAERAWWQQDRR